MHTLSTGTDNSYSGISGTERMTIKKKKKKKKKKMPWSISTNNYCRHGRYRTCNLLITGQTLIRLSNPSWDMTSIQRRLNVDATSWRCIDVETTLYECHMPAWMETVRFFTSYSNALFILVLVLTSRVSSARHFYFIYSFFNTAFVLFILYWSVRAKLVYDSASFCSRT